MSKQMTREELKQRVKDLEQELARVRAQARNLDRMLGDFSARAYRAEDKLAIIKTVISEEDGRDEDDQTTD